MKNSTKKLHRSQDDRMIAGVCSGLGDYFEIDPVLIRLLFLFSILFGGFGIVFYILLMFIIPKEPKGISSVEVEDKLQEITQEIKERAKDLKEEFQEKKKGHEDSPLVRNIVGVIIILVGLGFLIDHLLPSLKIMRWDLLWPTLIIFLGFLIIFKNRD